MRIRRRSPAAVAGVLLAPLLAPLLSASAAPAAADQGGPGPDAEPSVARVVAISLDGLNPRALRLLGRRDAPVLHRMMRQGAATLNARTERESTMTLPNHTGMVTGRRVEAATGGHGVTWNDERLRPATVQAAAGHPVSSVFDVVHDAGLSTALFASKAKFSLWTRSWPDAIDTSTIVEERDGAVLRAARADLATTPRHLTFVHLTGPDTVAHESGFGSLDYLRAVRAADRRVGRILDTIGSAGLAGETLVVLTSDHGGAPPDHYDPVRPANFRVPFLVVGPDVPAGADLYELNPGYRNPRNRRTSYAAGRQPIRNGHLANLVTDVLGLGAVPDSEHDAAQDLDVFATP